MNEKSSNITTQFIHICCALGRYLPTTKTSFEFGDQSCESSCGKMSANDVTVARRSSLPTYEEATASVRLVDDSESRNTSPRDRYTDMDEASTVIRYYRSDYVDETPTVIRYYASDYATGCVLQAPAVIKFYKTDYASSNYLQVDRRKQDQKHCSHGTTKKEIKPKASRVAATTTSTLQSFKNKVLKIPYLRMK